MNNHYFPKTKIYHLDNGLTIVWSPRKEINHARIEAMVNTGAAKESISGISHFFEHLIFSSPTQSLSTLKEVHEFKRSLGGWLEASTGYYSINLSVDIPIENLSKGLKIFKENLFYLKLKSEIFKSEKDRILQEIGGREDDIMLQLRNLLFKKHSGANNDGDKNLTLFDEAGSRESVQKISIKDLKDFYKRNFNPANILLMVSGPENLKEIIESHVVKEWGSVKNKNKSFPDVRNINFSNFSRYHFKQKDLKETYFAISFLLKPFSWKEERKLYFLDYILAEAKESIVRKMERKDLVYDMNSDHLTLPNESLFYFVGRVRDQSMFKNALSYLKDNLIKAVSKSMNETIFNQAKEKLLLLDLMDFERPIDFFDLVGYDFIKNKEVMAPKKEIENIKSISFKEMKDLMENIFSRSRMNILTMAKDELLK